jgi:hypothetical protein
MSKDGGLEVSRSAIKAARQDLEDVLELLAPGAAKRDVTPTAFPAGSAVQRLRDTPDALGGSWPAAVGIWSSLNNAATGVETAYVGISTTLEGAVIRLGQVLRNLDSAEVAAADRARRIDT